MKHTQSTLTRKHLFSSDRRNLSLRATAGSEAILTPVNEIAAALRPRNDASEAFHEIRSKFKSKSGVTLTELLVALIIAAVLALSVGTISMISIKSSADYKNEMEIYSDIAYGFKVMQKHVREMSAPSNPDTPGGAWVGERLVVNNITGTNSAFGLYQNVVTNSVDFVFVPDESDETVRNVLLSIPNSATPPNLDFTLTGSVYTVDISGVKKNIPFAMSTKILMRMG